MDSENSVRLCFNQRLSDFEKTLNIPGNTKKEKAISALCNVPGMEGVPSADMPFRSDMINLYKCNSDAFYYDYYGTGPDYTKARFCALHEPDYPMSDTPLHSSTILMMLYANGQGVTRDWLVAFGYACKVRELLDNSADSIELFRRLDAMKNAPATSQTIDICDYKRNNDVKASCALIPTSRTMYAHEQMLDQYAKSLASRAYASFQNLRQNSVPYFRSRAEYEINERQYGKIEQVKDVIKSRGDFAAMVIELKEKKLPPVTMAEVAKTEAVLHRLYRRIISSPHFRSNPDDSSDYASNAGDVSDKSVKHTQIRWLAYRRDWLDFVDIVAPESHAAIEQEITEQRIAQLRSILGKW
ncbi:hypothetical protein PT277_07410 [Acetobacteraceae bacterium ESL0709]|nr:hypothetical protein [Acetobacteraceae bacterium ESL0697]MDF7678511.1 hypothetical protein [Acetobacteraceae bacterium ESL0709]